MHAFSRPTAEWFARNFDAPTPVQERGWPRIAGGEHALLIAPTGSGKTLAAFLAGIDRLGQRAQSSAPGVRLLYVSPLKALVYDIERNLRGPLAGIRSVARELGEAFVAPRVAIRTGDSSAKERRDQAKNPAEILVTTPESLYLVLGSQQRETLRQVETIIIDEIHALAPSKRGAHLALSLERLCAGVERATEPQRIGLSATARPIAEVARFLGGDREVAVVDAAAVPRLSLEIRVPVEDMARPPVEADDAGSAKKGIWPALTAAILAEIRSHTSTIVFVNSRGLCERLAEQLNELAEEPLVRAHHGSLAQERRREIEGALKNGSLRGIVATSSLELGIDMEAVEAVILVESPGAVARGLQRIGRAGHDVGQISRGIVFPKHPGDLLESTVVAAGMRRGDVEALALPQNPLDVLAQQIVATCVAEPQPVDRLEKLVRRAANFRDLSRDALCSVLDMLSGRYPSADFSELRPRLIWDRDRDRLEARPGARQLAILSGGTIPDRGQYAVHLAEGHSAGGRVGTRVGELDEEMVNETRPGEILTLGASTWRVDQITRDRVLVSPAPGQVGKLPFWRGDGPGRPIELGRALGAFTRELGARSSGARGGQTPDDRPGLAEAWLEQSYGLDALAARNLFDYVVEQQEATGTLPTDRAVTIERFRDELGDWRICILSPFGSRLHAPWALAIESRLSTEWSADVQLLWSDDGIVLRLLDGEKLPDLALLLPDPEDLEDLVVRQLSRSALFAGQFRENAARALLLPRRRPGARTPLWTQRLRAQSLLAVAQSFASFPIVLETYRSCLQDVFDLGGLQQLLAGIGSGEIRVDEVETRQASPFARSLVFAYTATYLYQGDVPAAERRARALTLDRAMLRDLMGEEELRKLLDPEVLRETEAQLQGLSDERRARSAEGLADLLRRVGDLSQAEIRRRSDGEPAAWIESLALAKRAVCLSVGGEERWVAVEDAALYRDALGCEVPSAVPEALRTTAAAGEEPVEQLFRRFARTHGPFTVEALAERFALLPAQVGAVLRGLAAKDEVLEGAFRRVSKEREGAGTDWCDPEVMRLLRRRSLARLRDEVAPVDAPTLARFLLDWHGVVRARAAPDLDRLAEAIEPLEGVPLPFSDLEARILPARVAGFVAHSLDEYCASGQLVWIGCGALGDRDGRIALYRRDRVAALHVPESDLPALGELPARVLELLEARGAAFFAALAAALPDCSQEELVAALWQLVWAGRVTNDTLAPLRMLGSPRRSQRPLRPSARRTRRPGRTPRSSSVSLVPGRWSCVSEWLVGAPSPTEQAHARALTLLERYGVVSREALTGESWTGGFQSLYPVFKAMEDSGKLRRGHFVRGLSGAQFAYAGIVDRLRAARKEGRAPEALALAACDPANAYGTLLPWPESSSSATPRRAAGCSVILVDGVPVLFADRSVSSLTTFAGSRSDEAERAAAQALRRLFDDRTRTQLRVERIDGQAARESRWAQVLAQAGFRRDYKGLVLHRSEL